MRVYSLNGAWDLTYYESGTAKIRHPDELDSGSLSRVPAQVPGNVELDLAKDGKIPGVPLGGTAEDLFRGQNIHQVKAYETYEWWYRRQFATPADLGDRQVELVFDGVDCLAEYWLNGECIGSSENMFVEQHLDVTGRLKPGGVNQLAVHLRSALLEAACKDYPAATFAMATNVESLWIRKAPHSYGWDIMPRVLSAGLWRPVNLVVHDRNEIRDVYFYTRSVEAGRARLGVQYRLKSDDWQSGMTLRVRGQCGASVFETVQPVRFLAGSFELEVMNPQLWWPSGYSPAVGENPAANRYRLTMELVSGNLVLDTYEEMVGIRTVELVRTDSTSAEKPGEFLFKVNGVPILCKGSNHVPASAFHSLDSHRWAAIVDLYAEAGCNIIRSWGGNVYEDHPFLEGCDRAGILVWQDFAMACAFYPQDAAFQETMRAEATAVVRKLRNHACIVLWSGDNEVDEFMLMSGRDPGANQLTRSVLPAVIAAEDPYRPYLPSSPYYSPEVVYSREVERGPERHIWGPRDYFKSDFYSGHTAHFVSEMGYHGCPNLSSIEQFIDADSVWPWQKNPQWITHCTDSIGEGGPYAGRIQLMANQVGELFGQIPEKIEDFILASQVSQAEAKKYFIEMTRLKKWRRTGVIWWNMIDGWPQFSDAVVDYYFSKKLAYHYIRRVQQPVCLMIAEPHSWHVRLVAGNDSLQDAAGTYRVWDADSQETLASGEFRVPANQNVELDPIRISHSEQRLFLIEWDLGGKRFGNHYLLGHPAFSLEKYRSWLGKIAALSLGFDAQAVGK